MMNTPTRTQLLTGIAFQNRILLIRGEKVIVDSDPVKF